LAVRVLIPNFLAHDLGDLVIPVPNLVHVEGGGALLDSPELAELRAKFLLNREQFFRKLLSAFDILKSKFFEGRDTIDKLVVLAGLLMPASLLLKLGLRPALLILRQECLQLLALADFRKALSLCHLALLADDLFLKFLDTHEMLLSDI